jgi:hypothetical protein
MPEQLIDLAKYAYTEEDYQAELREEYEELVVAHTNIMYKALADPRLAEIEARLVNHPLTNINMHLAIVQRQIWLGALLYNMSNDPNLKRRMLLSLRERYQETQRLPEAWRDALAPLWAQWTEVLQREERYA